MTHFKPPNGRDQSIREFRSGQPNPPSLGRTAYGAFGLCVVIYEGAACQVKIRFNLYGAEGAVLEDTTTTRMPGRAMPESHSSIRLPG
jgi:hypothetical protein